MKFDMIIIGSGPGGYVAAIRAARLGLQVAVVEREHLVGICLNWGCIPTKALLRSAEVFDHVRHAKDYGLAADNVRFDAESVIKRSRDVATRLSRGVEGLLKKNKVAVIWGEARLTAPGRVTVSEAARPPNRPSPGKPDAALGPGDYSADHIIIATGARPHVLPGLEPDRERVWTYVEAMIPKRIPDTLLVVGAGAIGIEFASFYSVFGSKVVVVEMLPQILPAEDDEIAQFARTQFERQAIEIHTGAKITTTRHAPDGGLVATVEKGGESREFAVDAIIVAAGVQGNIANLGLEDSGVRTERGRIEIDGYGRTSVPGIYAIHPCSRTRRNMKASFASRPYVGFRPIPWTRCRFQAAPTVGRRSPAWAFRRRRRGLPVLMYGWDGFLSPETARRSPSEKTEGW